MEKRKPYYTVGGNANLSNHCGQQYGDASEKNTEFPPDPAVPVLGIYTEKTTTRKDTCTPMFIAALFAIAKTWKQPKCPSTEEWIKKMWYIYTMEYYSAVKRKEITAFVK